MKLLEDQLIDRIEKDHAGGLTSAEILNLFAFHGIPLSEATLRKYVQIGLLPRSKRVGSKGKHRGSKGIYPVSVVRQILRIKEMMAENYTIEQIQREFLFIRSDMEQLEQILSGIFEKLDEAMRERRQEGYVKAVARSVEEARGVSRDLLSRLGSIEQRLISGAQIQSASAS